MPTPPLQHMEVTELPTPLQLPDRSKSTPLLPLIEGAKPMPPFPL